MNGKSKYSQFDSKNVKSVNTNETHLFAGIISFFFPAWGELFRGHYKNWLLYSFIGLPLVILIMVMFAVTGIGIPIAGIILLLYQIKCARMSYNDKGLTEGLSGFFTKRNILIIILVVVIGIFAMRTIGLMYNDQQKAKVTPIVNNTTHNNTTGVNTTVEHINSEDTVNTVQKDDSSGQANDNNMPEDVRNRYAARQKAAEDGIPMYEYSRSPELVQKYLSIGFTKFPEDVWN